MKVKVLKKFLAMNKGDVFETEKHPITQSMIDLGVLEEVKCKTLAEKLYALKHEGKAKPYYYSSEEIADVATAHFEELFDKATDWDRDTFPNANITFLRGILFGGEPCK